MYTHAVLSTLSTCTHIFRKHFWDLANCPEYRDALILCITCMLPLQYHTCNTVKSDK